MAKADNNNHLFYMDQALGEAHQALLEDEVPIGAIVVDSNNEIIGVGHNRVEQKGCQNAHAEIIAIEQACNKRGDWRLDDCRIYITLEPCIMCFGLIILSRINAAFYGAKSPLFGCDIDNKESFPLYKSSLAVEGGLKADESASLLREFFEGRRAKKGNPNGE